MATAEQISALADALSGQLDEQKAADAAFRAQQEAAAQRLGSLQDEMLAKMLGKQRRPEQEYPAEILEIANALRAQPRLIPAVQAFLRKLVEKINAAVDTEIKAALGEVPK